MEFNKIKAILQDYAYTNEKDWKELKELERLARIAEIVEKIFLNGGSVKATTKLPGYEDPIPFGIYTVEELFKWAEREGQ